MRGRAVEVICLVVMLTAMTASTATPPAFAATPPAAAAAAPAPAPALASRPNELNGVSCPGAGTCMAVGYYDQGEKDQALVETLADGTWRVTPSPDEGSGTNVLNGVSCPSAGRAWPWATTTQGAWTRPWSRRSPMARGGSRPAPAKPRVPPS